VDEAREAEESAKAAAMKNTNTNGTDSSNTTSSTDKTKTSAKKQPKNTTKQKNNRRHLQNIPSSLEAFNPDPNNNTDAMPTETFVILSTSATEEGPRNSIGLEQEEGGLIEDCSLLI
jgi:hypothetical protein